MRAARARAIYAHSFVSHMRALACLSYARIMRVYTPFASARICIFDDCAYMAGMRERAFFKFPSSVYCV